MSKPIEELVADLIQTAELLDRHGVDPSWPALLRSYAERLEAGDHRAIAELLKDFGGMGSLNDLFISPMNGHRVEQGQVEAVNRKLDQLRERVFARAHTVAS